MIATFDIDHTMVVGTKSHHRALKDAMDQTFQVNTNLENRNFSGYVDWMILDEILIPLGISSQDIQKHLDSLRSKAVSLYQDYVSGEDIKVLPGVPELLASLKGLGYSLGLVTGNMNGIAQAKLARVGLAHYFSFGGYGCEDRDRSNLLSLALKRVQASPQTPSFHFGDTRQDMIASRNNQVIGIGVGTGSTTTRDLFSAGARSCFPDLSDTDKVLHALKLWGQHKP